MAHVEKETKLTLSAEDYLRIREGGKVLERRDQLNVYLHDPDRLREDLGYFRVRFEAGRGAVATLKIPVGWRGEMREMLEVEASLRDMGPALFPRPRRYVSVERDLPEAFRGHFLSLGILRLRRLGWMRNLRCVVELGPEGRVELDRTVLPGGEVVHEVEIESPREEAHRLLADRIREMAPSAEPSRTGKFTRFLDALGLHPLV